MEEKAFVKLGLILRDHCYSSNDIHSLLTWLDRQYHTKLVEEKIMALIDNIGNMAPKEPNDNKPEDILPYKITCKPD